MKFIEFESAQKLRGGYYTPKILAKFICRWILEINPTDILEPSCGNGIFFEALNENLKRKDVNILGFEIIKEEVLKSKRISLLGHKSQLIVQL